MSTHVPSWRLRLRAAATLVVLVALLTTLSPQPATASTIDTVCPAERVPTHGFRDVARGSTHEAAIACIVWYGVTQGRTSTSFDPNAVVTRGQMAAFLARTLDLADRALPSGSSGFRDTRGHPFERDINRVAAAGITQGRPDGTFAPNDRVTRAQMASFLVRAMEWATRTSLPAGRDRFSDDDGSVHEANIDKAAAAGIAAGVSSSRFDPDAVVRRQQMASFLARAMNHLVTEGAMEPKRPAPVYLSEMNAVDGAPSRGAAQLNGRSHPRSMWSRMGGCRTELVYEYDLARRFEGFAALVGPDDRADRRTRIQFDVFVDGRLVASEQTGLGQPVRLASNALAGASRLRLEAVLLAGNMGLCSNTGSAVWADAHLIVPDGAGDDLRGTAVVGDPIRYLSETSAVTGSPRAGARAIDGRSYARSIAVQMGGCTPSATYEYDLSRAYTRFATTLGVADGSPSDFRVHMRGFVDGREVFRRDVRGGQPAAVSVNVADGLRLRLEATMTGGSTGLCSNAGTAVWGDAALTR
jgi:hypothetical protein